MVGVSLSRAAAASGKVFCIKVKKMLDKCYINVYNRVSPLRRDMADRSIGAIILYMAYRVHELTHGLRAHKTHTVWR